MKNLDSRDELIRMLFEREREMTEEVLETMISHLASEETLQLLLDRLEDLEIIGKILPAAASNPWFTVRRPISGTAIGQGKLSRHHEPSACISCTKK